jgi:hypothetical protein
VPVLHGPEIKNNRFFIETKAFRSKTQSSLSSLSYLIIRK